MIGLLGACSPDPIAFQLALHNSVAFSKFRVHVFPAMRALIRISGADQGHLVKGAARELEADGQSPAIEPAGQGYCG